MYGYLHTDDIVAGIASLRPYSRLIRTRESMTFARSVGVSTDADGLDYRRPARTELDLFRDRIFDNLAMGRIIQNGPIASDAMQDFATEVMRVFVHVATVVQSRRGSQTSKKESDGEP